MDAEVVPRLAVVAAGGMGAAIAKRLTRAGCIVYTDLDGRSEATRQRANEAGMQDASLGDIVVKADWILSILPPRDAFSFAERVRNAAAASGGRRGRAGPLVFVDCNAVSPETVKQIAGVFVGTGIKFIDAGIIGLPPKEGHDPRFYASAAGKDRNVLEAFAALSKYGLKISALTGEGADVGDASAVKMSFAGIYKGTVGVYTTMILAAHASSPATAEALMRQLRETEPRQLERVIDTVPKMFAKAYRWVGEMEEIGEFVGGEGQEIYSGVSRVYGRIERSLDGDKADVDVLNRFVENAKKLV